MIKLPFKKLITVILLSSCSCSLATAHNKENTEDMRRFAPEATIAEAKLSFRDIPNLGKAFIDVAPIDRKDGILVGELGVDGGDKAMIVKLAQEIADNKHGSYDSLLIAHKDKLVFESYYSRGRINLPHFQASATKAYTSMALGRAIQLGYLSMADLDKPLVSFLKGLEPSKFAEGVEKITLHQAMTMRSGIRLSDEQRKVFEKNPSQLKGQRQVQVFLEQTAPITSRSQSFKYQDDPRLVMQVIDAVVPGSAKGFIKNELLDKMGITNYGWQTDESGLPSSGWGSNMTSRNMLKWGTLAVNKGKWNGEQLVPEAFINKATSRILHTGDDDVYGGGKDVSKQGYGYYWWSADLKVGNDSYFSASAQGGGGQYIILIEELDLLIVITDHDNDNNSLQITAERILPAFIQNYIPTISVKSDSRDKSPLLEGPYLGQKPPGLIPKAFAPRGLSTEHRDHSGFFTPDMQEFYFTRRSHKDKKWSLIVFKSKNNRWQESVVGPRVGRPILTPNGKTMHLGKRYMERTKTGWSEVKPLGSFFKDFRIMRLMSSSNGTYFFDDATESGPIRYSRLINGKHEKPKAVNIDFGDWNAHPFIAPDESYLIWDDQGESGYGGSDLYISYRQKDGTWGAAINFGDKINTDANEGGAIVTPDGKYLFFNRFISNENAGMYWVDLIATLQLYI